jgi:HK97 family phage major capsid protein
MYGDDADWSAHKSAVSAYMRKGKDTEISALQAKAMSVDSNQDGGFFVMPDTSGRIVQQVYETSPMRRLASVQTISTDALEGIYDLDEAAAAWVGEQGARNETASPKVNMWRIPVHEIYAEPRATQKLLDDANVDVEAWLAGKVANKFARAEAQAFVSGDGVGKPRGFLTYATSANAPTATSWNVIQYLNTGVNGDYAGSGLGGDNLINLHGLLKAEYLPGSVWAMNRTTKAKTRTLKDPDGNYLLQLDFRQGLSETILGYPVENFEDMPNYTGTGALAVAFGNFASCYQIVDRVGIRVLRDPFTAKPFVKFYTTKRVGGDVINFEAVKVLRFSA